MNMKLREIVKKMHFILTLLIVLPIIILGLSGLLWPNEIIYGLIAALLVEIPLIIYYCLLKDLHKKRNEEARKYFLVKDYIAPEMNAEKQRRREQFERENNRYNKFDTLYFGRDSSPNSELKKEESLHQNVIHYLEGMDKNYFGIKFFSFLEKKNANEFDVCQAAGLDHNIINLLHDPSYQIKKRNAIRLALALKLTINEAQELLEQAGYYLDKLREFDCAICYFFENALYNLEFINLALFEAGLAEL